MNPYELLAEDFHLECQERLDRIESLLLQLAASSVEERRELLEESKRELHTLKGNSGMMGFKDLQEIAHRLEDDTDEIDVAAPGIENLLAGLDGFRGHLSHRFEQPGSEDARSKKKNERDSIAVNELGSVRVPFAELDDLVDLLAEMVIFRNRLGNAIFSGLLADQANRHWEETAAAQESLKKTLVLIQDRIMRLRMVPLRMLFRSLQRIVHDESTREGKKVVLETIGGDTPMDKALLEVASEALGHLIRNAVVHGVEESAERVAQDKSPTGLVRLSAATHSNEVWLDVEDDGRGIDPANLLVTAAERGIAIPDGSDPFAVLFESGFTTRDDADIAAGRGVGLSAVLESIQRVGGRIETTSRIGQGSSFRIKLPLNVSITRAMLMRVDGEEYALPIASVVESMRFNAGDGHRVNQAGVFHWRDEVIPTLDLGYVMGTAREPRAEGFVVVVEAEGKHRGIIVDLLTGMKEIVVKGLDSLVGTPEGISGSTILGDGRVLLILDPRSLVTIKPFVAGGASGKREREEEE